MIYWILFIVCILVELSPRINTDNHVKKIGIGIIAVGALIESYGRHSMLIEMGMIVYFIASILSAYCWRNHRRAADR